MKTHIPDNTQYHTPTEAEIKVITDQLESATMQYTLKKGTVSKALRHKTVTEFWHILSGSGAIWRRNETQESILPLKAGMSIDVPLGTDFQYCSDKDDLIFICITLPPASDPDEASVIEDCAWKPT